MSRRTFPRAVAAGLIVAALGGPAAGQAPNPWRGESALPTAPAPRLVGSKPTRMLSIGLGFSSVGGLTANIEVRALPQTTPAVGLTRATPDSVSIPHDKLPDFAEYTPYRGPRSLPTITDPQVRPASYIPVPSYMPPPAPLPVQYIPPAAK